MLTKRTIIIIIIAVIVIIGLAVALLLADQSFFVPKQENQPVNQEPAQGEENNHPSPAKGLELVEPVVVLSPLEQTLITVATNFAERYGSFSTDSRFANLKEVKLLATARLQSELDKMINTQARAEEFYGVSSKALKINIESLDENAGQAEATVILQRAETKAGKADWVYPAPVSSSFFAQSQCPKGNWCWVYHQNLSLTLIRSGESWLVNSAQWQ